MAKRCNFSTYEPSVGFWDGIVARHNSLSQDLTLYLNTASDMKVLMEGILKEIPEGLSRENMFYLKVDFDKKEIRGGFPHLIPETVKVRDKSIVHRYESDDTRSTRSEIETTYKEVTTWKVVQGEHTPEAREYVKSIVDPLIKEREEEKERLLIEAKECFDEHVLTISSLSYYETLRWEAISLGVAREELPEKPTGYVEPKPLPPVVEEVEEVEEEEKEPEQTYSLSDLNLLQNKFKRK